MGQPGWLKASHRRYAGRTRGTETSQYPQEEKEIIDSLSSGDRKGKSPNLWRYGAAGVVGPPTRVHDVNWNRLESRSVEGDRPVQASVMRRRRDTCNPVRIRGDHPARLNTPGRPIVNQYREGKVGSTPSRGVK